jgi:hypothetical protein
MPIYAVQLKMVRDPSVQMGVTLLLHSIQFSKIFETEVHHSQKVINPSMMKILCFHGRGSNVQVNLILSPLYLELEALTG